MNTSEIENLTQNAKIVASENGRTSNVGWREMYRLADKRYLTVLRNSADDFVDHVKVTFE